MFEIQESNNQSELPMWVCGKCGHPNAGKDKFCKKCGQKNMLAPKEWKCKRCGNVITGGYAFCGACGEKYEEKDYSSWTCSRCNTRNESSDEFCRGCNIKRGAKQQEEKIKLSYHSPDPVNYGHAQYGQQPRSYGQAQNPGNTQPYAQYPQYTHYPNGSMPYPMKWYNLLVYFGIWMTALMLFYMAYSYFKYYNALSEVYKQFSYFGYSDDSSDIRGFLVFFGLFALALGIWAIVAGVNLIGFKQAGPKVYLSFIIAQGIMVVLAYIMLGSYSSKLGIATENTAFNVIFSLAYYVGFYAANRAYFNRREELFCNL